MIGMRKPFRVVLFSLYGVVLCIPAVAVFYSEMPAFMALAVTYLALLLVWILSGAAWASGYERARRPALAALFLQILFALAWVASLYDLVGVFVRDARLIEPARTASIAICFVAGMAIPAYFFYTLHGSSLNRIWELPIVPVLLIVSSVYSLASLLLGLPAPFFAGWLEGTAGAVTLVVLAVAFLATAWFRLFAIGLALLLLVCLALTVSLTVQGQAQLASAFLTPVIICGLVTAFLLYLTLQRTRLMGS